MIESFLMSWSLGLIFIAIITILAGYLLPIPTYKIPLQFIGIILLTYMLFLTGKSSERAVWDANVAESKLELARMEAKSADVSTKVVIKYIDKIQYVDRIKTQVVHEYVTKENDEKCQVNQGFVNLHNSTAKGTETVKLSTDNTPSAIKLSDIADTIKINYSNSLKNSAQLESLQDWIKQQGELRK